MMLLGVACGDGSGGGDACNDADCVAPPAPTCDGDTRVTFAAFGVCESGACTYFESRLTCNDTCEDGACVESACEGDACDPCADVTCDGPPAPRCDGSLAIAYASLGTCDSGTCAYRETRTTCTSSETCELGACRRIEACATEDCDTPPTPSCDGTVAVRHDEPGVCSPDGCIFTPTREDCADTGRACVSGTCVGDPCQDVVCDAPPDATCDGATALTYEVDGTCEANGACSYDTTRTDCAIGGQTCLDGACVDGDPCENVTCTSLPAGTCEGSVATFPTSGACVDGACDWTEASEDCATNDEICVLGACVPSDPCASLVCDEPEPTCDGSVAVTPIRSRCNDGACVDELRRDACGERGLACRDGACVVGDPCEGVTCDELPQAQCAGDFLVPWQPGGLCADGVCRFAEGTPVDCSDDGLTCRAGACVDPGSCDEACDTPPAPFCSEGSAVAYSLPGACVDGACAYEQDIDNCESRGLSCVDGACVDPCSGITCEASVAPLCDGFFAVTQTNGRCVDGACAWDEAREDCTAGAGSCFDGACVDDCGGTCATPPAPTCIGTNAITHVTPGACEIGGCVYEPVTTSCAALGLSCREGGCVSLCEGVVCDDPPADDCPVESVARSYDLGDCLDGTCAYDEILTPCDIGTTCVDGACVDACSLVDCTTPPAPLCVLDSLLSFAPGPCEDGVCLWDETLTDCREAGRLCEDGACYDPCDDVICEPGPPTCDASVLIEPTVEGCLFGDCIISETFRFCANEEAYCFEGDCIPGDPCTGVTCFLAPFCEGDTRVTWDGEAACDTGFCVFDDELQIRTDCFASSGETCIGGECATVPVPRPGDIVVSELAPIGAGALSTVAWFEIGNISDRRINLSSTVIRDANGLTRPLNAAGATIGAGEFRVFAITNAPGVIPGSPLDGATVLNPSQLAMSTTGSLTIVDGATEISHVAWDHTWEFEPGRSLQLDIEARDDALGDVDSWCASWGQIDASNIGSPFEPGFACTPAGIENVTPGLLRITEVMVVGRADQPATSWWVEFESYENRPIEIDGMLLELGTSTVTLDSDRVVPPEGMLVIGGVDALLPGVDAVIVDFEALMDVTQGRVRFTGATHDEHLDAFSWGPDFGGSTVVGTSWQRDRFHDLEAKCRSGAMPNAGGQRGTPGQPNRSCLGTLDCNTDLECPALADTCDGAMILRVPSSGVCGDRGCDYRSSLQLLDCPNEGEVCESDGVCVAIPPDDEDEP